MVQAVVGDDSKRRKLDFEIISKSVHVAPDGRLDRRNAAIYLGCTPKCLAERLRKGLRPRSIKRLGRRWYWKSELDAYLAEGDALLASLAGFDQRRLCGRMIPLDGRNMVIPNQPIFQKCGRNLPFFKRDSYGGNLSNQHQRIWFE